MTPVALVALIGEVVTLVKPLIDRIERIQKEDPALWAELSAKYPQLMADAHVQLDAMKPVAPMANKLPE